MSRPDQLDVLVHLLARDNERRFAEARARVWSWEPRPCPPRVLRLGFDETQRRVFADEVRS